MRLDEILRSLDVADLSGDSSAEITGVAYDSRKVEPGHLFVAMRGEATDGHEFIGDAIARGAAAVVYQEPAPLTPWRTDAARPCLIRVRDSRAALADASNSFYGRPSQELSVIGITGTNGKTTTSYIIKSILEHWQKKVGLIGTIRYLIGDQSFDAPHTTPEASDLQALLREMLRARCTHVVAEVSSHALAQKRVDGTVFASRVFTNLTRDHLDYHKTMEEYFHAKERLFTGAFTGRGSAVVNYDDPWGRRLIASIPGECISYGLEEGSDVRATDIAHSPGGLRFGIIVDGETHAVRSPLVGLPNVYNTLAAAACCRSLGVPWKALLEGIERTGTIDGRFERVDAGQDFLAVVDYAHTEDALERLIYTARGLTPGKIITVFGCGGDRDKGKRPRMGAIATRLSDFVVITSDNPRSERPGTIMEEIASGAARKNYLLEADRKEAIRRAVLMAEDGDTVLVAGKGHEHYQEIKGERFIFSDKEVLKDFIAQSIRGA